jgi:hypothetical protein
MDHRAVILDGITLQHVGEILLDVEATADVRRLCASSYLQSLEDFVFGALFGESLTLSGTMPPVGEDTPGAHLLHRPELRDFVVAIDMPPPPSPSEIVAGEGLRGAVERDINAIGSLTPRELGAFQDFYVREARAYLGNDASILEPRLPPASYAFSTNNRASHYVQVAELQSVVPQRFIDRMLVSIRGSADYSRVANEALTEFVTRSLLTHVVNYWTFDSALEAQPHASARLPHVTRANIRRHVDGETEETQPGGAERLGRFRRLFYRGIVPHALLRVMAVARDKSSFLDAVRETRDSTQFRQIRNYLTELVSELGHGERREADKLLAEIARRTSESGDEPEPWELSVPQERGQQMMNPGKYYLRRLIREAPFAAESDYRSKVAGMFADLLPAR